MLIANLSSPINFDCSILFHHTFKNFYALHQTQNSFCMCSQCSTQPNGRSFLNQYGSENFEVESAGLEPGTLNPFAIEVMKEKGFDISKKILTVFLIYLKRKIV